MTTRILKRSEQITKPHDAYSVHSVRYFLTVTLFKGLSFAGL